MKKKTLINIFKKAAFCTLGAFFLVACGTKKKVVEVQSTTSATQTQAITPQRNVLSSSILQKIMQNELNENSIVANISFSAQAAGKSINCPGSLKMYKDKMVRMQLFIPLLGTEVGRLEFTPTHVLVVDRIHREYIKATYEEVDFLKNNGLNFYSLQALFWNKLFKPAQKTLLNEYFADFQVESQNHGAETAISLTDKKLTYVWNTDATTGKINTLNVQYDGSSPIKAGLSWNYSGFVPVGQKSFPASQSFTLQTQGTQNAQKATISFELSGIKTNREAEEETTLSAKYKKIEPKEILSKIIPN